MLAVAEITGKTTEFWGMLPVHSFFTPEHEIALEATEPFELALGAPATRAAAIETPALCDKTTNGVVPRAAQGVVALAWDGARGVAGAAGGHQSTRPALPLAIST